MKCTLPWCIHYVLVPVEHCTLTKIVIFTSTCTRFVLQVREHVQFPVPVQVQVLTCRNCQRFLFFTFTLSRTTFCCIQVLVLVSSTSSSCTIIPPSNRYKYVYKVHVQVPVITVKPSKKNNVSHIFKFQVPVHVYSYLYFYGFSNDVICRPYLYLYGLWRNNILAKRKTKNAENQTGCSYELVIYASKSLIEFSSMINVRAYKFSYFV